jgi:flagellar biosynthesis protein FliQ
MGHPYAPAGLQLPGFVPLQLSQGQVLAPYLGTSLVVVLAIWLISGAVTLGPFSLAISPRIIAVAASI